MFKPLAIASLLALPASLFAAPAVPAAPFGDNMVLQREMPVPVWGTAAPGAKIGVVFAGQTKETIADATGDWLVKLDPMPASAENRELAIVAGDSKTVLKDVLVGEVWLCSGQSNMQVGLGDSPDAKTVFAAATDPLLRVRSIHLEFSAVPLKQFVSASPWVPGTGEQLRSISDCGGFSAVAYHFGRELRQQVNVPVGLIQSARGGTCIESWTPPCGFKKFPNLQPQPPPASEIKDVQQPTALYNGHIHPLIPYAIRGAIWYQGEANCLTRDNAAIYLQRMQALVGGWRQAWGQGDFPFYFVQIAPFDYRVYGGRSQDLLEIWTAQNAAAKTIPNTGMAIINDVGDIKRIHPADKATVGQRLARLALSRTYGMKVTDDGGPIFKAMAIAGGQITVEFDYAKSGLAARDGKPLSHFEIAGADGHFVPAEATIEGSKVIVRSPQVAAPTQVRFAWDQCAVPNLMNGDKLPASPFRTGK
jgi:sialate O-acetylesterase